MNAKEEKLIGDIAELKQAIKDAHYNSPEVFVLKANLAEKEKQLRALRGEPEPESCKFGSCSVMGGRKKMTRRRKAKRRKTVKRRKKVKRRKTAKRGNKVKRGKKTKGRRTKRR